MVNQLKFALRLPHLPSLVWQFLSTQNGVTALWLTMLSLLSALGINQTSLKLPETHVLLMTLVCVVVSGITFKSRARLRIAVPGLVGLGGGYLLWEWARLGTSMEQIFGAMATVAGSYLYRTDPVPALTRLQTTLLTGNQRALILGARITHWLSAIGRPATADWLTTQLAWGAAIWLAVAFLSLMVWRYHHVLPGTLPLGILLATALFFSGKSHRFMVFFLAGMLLLQASVNGLRNFRDWEKRRVDYATDIFVDMQAAAATAIMVIVVTAAAAPNISIADLTRAFYRVSNIDAEQVNQIASSFGLNPPPDPIQTAGLQGLPRRHLLGGSPELSRQHVMTIRTGELPPLPETEADSVNVPRHYWQAVVYNRYTSQGWYFSAGRPVNFDAEQPLHNLPPFEGRLLQQTIERGPFSGRMLYSDGLPVTISQLASARQNAQGEAMVVTLDAQTYNVSSWQEQANPSILRAAGEDYPESIKQAYLSLPETVPQRVRDLALDLTVTQPTPFDKALAIETYLRGFAYTLDVPQPPLEADVADYFLFDLQKGYCDYYATSMVVLARAAGLPARFVIGYASGSYSLQRAEYHIVETDAHSWPQIYFPGVGWVNFEPTAGQPPLERSEGGPAATPADLPPPAASSGVNWPVILWLGAVGLTGLGWGTGWAKDRRLRRTPPRQLSAILFRNMWRLAKRTGFQTQTGDTPYEFSGRYSRFLQAQALPAAAQSGLGDIHRLAEAFVYRQYAPPGRSSDDLWPLWRRLRRALWLATVWIWLKRWGQKITRRVYQNQRSQV